MIISYDLDGTITDNPELAQVANAMQAMGHRNIVLTGRKSETGIRELLQSAGFPEDTEIITKENHSGTTRDFKSKMLQQVGADWHFDNDENLNLPQWHPTRVLTFQKNRLKFGSVRR